MAIQYWPGWQPHWRITEVASGAFAVATGRPTVEHFVVYKLLQKW